MYINSSSLELVSTCLRKANYVLTRGLRSDSDSPALAFGSAVHKGLENWYCLPVGSRELPSKLRETAEMYAAGYGLTEQADGALESIRQAVLCKQSALNGLPEGDKRSLSNLVKILIAYFKTYKDDQLEVVRDKFDIPMIEREVEFPILLTPELEIYYFGTIDVILRNTQTNMIMVADHKTTSALGSEFYNRCKPNPQYTGYVMGAQQMLGLNTNLFMVNGIFVGKTQNFARQVTDRTEDDFNELKASVIEVTSRWLSAVAKQIYPQNAPNPCSMYGGCQFLQVCQVPEKLREGVIRSKWGLN